MSHTTANNEMKVELAGVTIIIKQDKQATQELTYVLPDNFATKNQLVKAQKLDTEQCVLFFDLLRSMGIIGKYDNPSLAKLVHYLTGWSEKCLREDLGTNFREIKKFKQGKPSDFNLQVLRTNLLEMLEEVEKEIQVVQGQIKSSGEIKK